MGRRSPVVDLRRTGPGLRRSTSLKRVNGEAAFVGAVVVQCLPHQIVRSYRGEGLSWPSPRRSDWIGRVGDKIRCSLSFTFGSVALSKTVLSQSIVVGRTAPAFSSAPDFPVCPSSRHSGHSKVVTKPSALAEESACSAARFYCIILHQHLTYPLF